MSCFVVICVVLLMGLNTACNVCESCFSMAERMLSGEIKEGDSAIIDVDGDGNVTVLNGSTGTASSTAIEAPAGIS